MSQPQPPSETSTRTIAILCALGDTELPALLLAFGQTKDAPASGSRGDTQFWDLQISVSGAPVRIVIGCMATSGNTESALNTRNLLDFCSPEVCIFSGIACGTRAHSLGDVIVSKEVANYEYAKTSPSKEKPRPRTVTSSGTIQRLKLDAGLPQEFRRVFARVQAEFPKDHIPEKVVSSELLWDGIVVSGEKVLANGELSRMKEANDRVCAGEMEGYAFAKACDEKKIPWLLVRGLSDYGDPQTKGQDRASNTSDESEGAAAAPDESAPLDVIKKDEYHLVAAVAAAACVRAAVPALLETRIRPDRGAKMPPPHIEQPEARESGVLGTLPDSEIHRLAACGLLIQSGFSPDCVEQACYELRAGSTYYELRGGTKKHKLERGQTILIRPNQSIVVITEEQLRLPADTIGRILTKGKLFSLGILPVNTYADPGFAGHMGIVLHNASSRYIKLLPGTPIAKIEFSRMAIAVDTPYRGQHGYQTEIWPVPDDAYLTEEEEKADHRIGSFSNEFGLSHGRNASTVLNVARAALIISLINTAIIAIIAVIAVIAQS